MTIVKKIWANISQFVHSGRVKKIKVSGVKITLPEVRKILHTLHSKERKREEKVIEKVGLPEPRNISFLCLCCDGV